MYTYRRIHHLRPWTCGVEGSSLDELLSMDERLANVEDEMAGIRTENRAPQ